MLPTFVIGCVLLVCVVRSANGTRRVLKSGATADPRTVDTSTEAAGKGGETVSQIAGRVRAPAAC